ncbi:uncharacterized protein [Haliotis asinina]|uniref:uncharacterized protein n=1 Tax=Haliotis asinina TaxID=109174 RepID=UPI003531A71A
MRLLILEIFLLVGILEYVHTDDGGVACGIVDQLTCDNFEESRVCGSDGRDYFNDCDFAKAHCHDTTLHVGYVGECRTSTVATTTPPSTHPANANLLCKVLLAAQCNDGAKELCGTDGKTYFNLCKFEQAKCSSPGLAVDHPGVCVTLSPLCQAFDIAKCGESRKEVCASDNITYHNLCFFQKAQCHDTSLSLVHEGSCESSHAPGTSPTTPSTTTTSLPDTSTTGLSPTCQALIIALCGSNVEPMCGSNGITYANPCQLKKAECFDPSIKLVSVGHCASKSLASTQSTTSKPRTSQAITQKTQESTSSSSSGPVTSPKTLQTTRGSTTPLPITSQETTQTTQESTTPLPTTSKETTQTTQESTTPLPTTTLPTTPLPTTTLPTTPLPTTTVPTTSKETTQTTQESTTPLPTTTLPTTPLPTTTLPTTGSTVPVMTLSPLDIICRAIMHFNCPSTPEPVCGSDGKTYPNECEFEKARCTHRHLHVASFGPCN